GLRRLLLRLRRAIGLRGADGEEVVGDGAPDVWTFFRVFNQRIRIDRLSVRIIPARRGARLTPSPVSVPAAEQGAQFSDAVNALFTEDFVDPRLRPHVGGQAA